MGPSALSRCHSRSGVRTPVAVGLCLATAGALAGCPATGHPAGTSDPAPGQVGANRPPDHVAAGPLHGRTGASLTVRDAAARVEIRLTDLSGLLYRITTPPTSGLAPQVTG